MKKQPAPKKSNKNKDIVDLVIKDLKTRKKQGLDTYGVPLRAFNGRDSLLDFFEEELDKILYFKQWLLEREKIISVIKFYSTQDNGKRALRLLNKLNEI